MLNIPAEIKELLKSDSVHKNFRVHFPNNERADITNENIVSESVSFTESICSNTNLQFGLCENSVIQFETFGIGKIKGYKIECSMEIECPSNVEGSEYKEDIQKNVYAIPYGTFIIDSCKKQADMTHRRVIAYSENPIQPNILTSNEVNLAKMQMYSTGKQDFVQNLDCLFYSELPELAFSDLEYGEHEGQYFHHFPLGPVLLFLTDKRGSSCNLRVIGDDTESVQAEQYNSKYLFGFKLVTELSDSLILDCWNRFVQSVEEADVLSSESLQQLKQYPIENAFSILYPHFYKYCRDKRTGNEIYSIDVQIKKSIFVCYPYSANTATNDEIQKPGALFLPCGFAIREGAYDETDIVDPCYYLTNDDVIVDFDISEIRDIQVSSKRIKSKVQDNRTLYLPEKYPIESSQTLVQSMCELKGLMGKPNRFGGYEFISIMSKFGALYPHIELYPNASLFPSGNVGIKMDGGLYNSLWYDDDYTLPFGKIECDYNNGTEDVKGIYYLPGFDDSSPSDSYQTLVIKNNTLINATTISDADMNTIFEEIASNISGIVYMPLEMDMVGRPDLEAGDIVEIVTTEGHITSIVLERTLTGIQLLTDNITST